MYTSLVIKKLIASNKIYIGKSKIPGAGRGVFANQTIKKGELVETCPIIEVSKHDTSNLKESILVTYFFYFGKTKEKLAMALGFGSIYNHSDNPNIKYRVKSKEETIEFTATKTIKRNEEMTFNYSDNQNSKNKKKPLWFEVWHLGTNQG